MQLKCIFFLFPLPLMQFRCFSFMFFLYLDYFVEGLADFTKSLFVCIDFKDTLILTSLQCFTVILNHDCHLTEANYSCLYFINVLAHFYLLELGRCFKNKIATHICLNFKENEFALAGFALLLCLLSQNLFLINKSGGSFNRNSSVVYLSQESFQIDVLFCCLYSSYQF